MLETLTARQRTLLVFVAGSLAGVVATVAVGALLGRPDAGRRLGVEREAAEGDEADASSLAGQPSARPTAASPTRPGAAADESYPYGVRGRVTDAAGRGLPGARITVRDGEGGPPRRVVSGPDGGFEVSGLPLGLYVVEANASGFAGASVEGLTPGGEPFELRLVGAGAAVGRVVSEGQGVSGVTVLIGAPGVFPPARQSSGAEGRFAVETWTGVELIEVAAFGDEHGSGFVRRAAPSDGDVFELALHRAPRLRLELADESGGAVTSGVVTIAAGPLHLLDVSAPIEAGRAELRGLPEGEYHARLRAPGFLPWEGTLAHGAASGEPIRLTLRRGGEVTGRVVDAAGQGVPGVHVTAVVRDANGRRWRFGLAGDGTVAQHVTPEGHIFWPPDSAVQSGDEGAFRIAGLPAGRVVLVASSPTTGGGQTDSFMLGEGALVSGVEVRVSGQ
jgi:hypothetical protein